MDIAEEACKKYIHKVQICTFWTHFILFLFSHPLSPILPFFFNPTFLHSSQREKRYLNIFRNNQGHKNYLKFKKKEKKRCPEAKLLLATN